MKHPMQKKIVAGKYKGKTLQLPSMQTTRSSKAIVLESFFNTLQYDVIDATFVECFAGSGSIGLEALSRGAKRIIFMEQDRAALRVLRSNIAQTDPSVCDVVAGSSFETITQVIARVKQLDEPAYFYIDPPFSIREGHEKIYDQVMQLIATLPTAFVKMIVLEHMSGLALDLTIGPYAQIKQKKFGKTTLTYYGASDA
jgi:16S rRNA (guanine966-N2)-methyltransferase